MKILIVVNCLRGGGAERMISLQANYWQRNGNEVSVITFQPANDKDYPLDSRIIHEVACFSNPESTIFSAVRGNFQRIRAVRAYAKSNGIDVIVGSMAHSGVVAALAAAGLASKSISIEQLHPPLVDMNLPWRWLRKYSYRFCDTVAVLTDRSACWIKQNTLARNITVIPNSYADNIPSLPPRKFPSQFIPDGSPLVIGAGRLSDQKAFDRLLTAFDQVAEKHPDWHLAILGDGELRDDLETLRQQLSSRDRIHFPGNLGNITDWYERSDLFVLSSKWEGFPLVLIEAMSCGCAVLATDCETGPAEIIEHGANGWLVESSETGLISGMEKLLADKTTRVKLAGNASDSIKPYSIDNIMKQWDSLLQEMLNGKT